jgi:rhamnose transport system permease protein
MRSLRLAPAALPALVALLALLALLVLLAPSFFAPANVRDVVISNAMVQIIAVGMTMVILTGHVDVAVGAAAGVCAVLAATLSREGVPPLAAAAIATMAGGLIGLMSGLLVARLRLPSIVVTLAMLVILRDGLRWSTDGAWVGNLPASFQWFGLWQGGGQTLLVGFTAAVILAGAWFLRNTSLGRAVYATGSDAESAELLGLRPDRVVVASFVTCGVLTGLAAALNASRFAEVPGAITAGLEMKVIAAVVVGGTSITGGRGSIAGTVIGVALLGAIGTGLTFLGVSAYWEKALQGAIILAAILYETVAARRKQPGPANSNPSEPDPTRPNPTKPVLGGAARA